MAVWDAYLRGDLERRSLRAEEIAGIPAFVAAR